jgi:hypothetical protein
MWSLLSPVDKIGVYFKDGQAVDYTVEVTDKDGTFYVWARNLDMALEVQSVTGTGPQMHADECVPRVEFRVRSRVDARELQRSLRVSQIRTRKTLPQKSRTTSTSVTNWRQAA